MLKKVLAGLAAFMMLVSVSPIITIANNIEEGGTSITAEDSGVPENIPSTLQSKVTINKNNGQIVLESNGALKESITTLRLRITSYHNINFTFDENAGDIFDIYDYYLTEDKNDLNVYVYQEESLFDPNNDSVIIGYINNPDYVQIEEVEYVSGDKVITLDTKSRTYIPASSSEEDKDENQEDIYGLSEGTLFQNLSYSLVDIPPVTIATTTTMTTTTNTTTKTTTTTNKRTWSTTTEPESTTVTTTTRETKPPKPVTFVSETTTETTEPTSTTTTTETTTSQPTTTTTTSKPTTTTSESTTTTTTTETTISQPTTTSTTTTKPSERSVVQHIASDEELGDWSVNDYNSKHDIPAVSAEITETPDGQYQITLTDDSENVLDVYEINPENGIGTDSKNNEVNLPQTGNNSLTNMIIALGSLIMTASGFVAVKSSGIIRRKKNK